MQRSRTSDSSIFICSNCVSLIRVALAIEGEPTTVTSKEHSIALLSNSFDPLNAVSSAELCRINVTTQFLRYS